MFQTLRSYLQAFMWLHIKTTATSVRLDAFFLPIYHVVLRRQDRFEHKKALAEYLSTDLNTETHYYNYDCR